MPDLPLLEIDSSYRVNKYFLFNTCYSMLDGRIKCLGQLFELYIDLNFITPDKSKCI